MYNNIGNKIKGLAIAAALIGTLVSVIVGLLYLSNGIRLSEYSEEAGVAMVMTGFGVMLIGGLLSWLSTLTLYGFGHLIENTDRILERIPVPTAPAVVSAPAAAPAPTYRFCAACGERNRSDATACSKCATPLKHN